MIHEWECSIRPGLAGIYIETTSPALTLPTIPYLPKATSRPLPPFRTPQKTHCRHFPLSLAHITNATNSTKAYTSPLPSTQDPSLPNPTLPTLPTAQKVFTLPPLPATPLPPIPTTIPSTRNTPTRIPIIPFHSPPLSKWLLALDMQYYCCWKSLKSDTCRTCHGAYACVSAFPFFFSIFFGSYILVLYISLVFIFQD